MKKLLLVVLASAVTVIFLLGFVDRVNEVPVQSKEVFTYAINTIPRNLKNVGELDKREQDIICATSKGLVELDKDNKIIPSLAESVDVKQDGIEYNFKIKSDIYWSNGEKITTKDISNFFKEILTEENEEDITTIMNVYGAKKFRNGEGTFAEAVGIQTTDNEITIRLNSKNDKFLEELSKPQYRVRKDLYNWQNISDKYSSVIYSGDYSISSMDMSEIVLKRNTKSDLKLVESIHIIEDEGEELAMAAYEVGNRDIVINPPSSQLGRLKEANKLISFNSDFGMYLAFNPKGESLPLEGKKEIYSLINKAMGDYQVQNEVLLELADGSYFRTDKDDLAKLQSRKVMSNNYGEWKEPEEIVIVAEENTENKDVCNFLSEWFLNNSNMTLTYKLLNKTELQNIQDETYYNIALLNYEAPINNKKMLYESMGKFIPESYIEKLQKAKSEDENNAVLANIEDELFNTYSVLPLLFYNENIAMSDKIKNITLDGNGNMCFNLLEK